MDNLFSCYWTELRHIKVLELIRYNALPYACCSFGLTIERLANLFLSTDIGLMLEFIVFSVKS